MTTIAERLAEVRARIQAAALGGARDPEQIALIAVSKKMPASAIREAYAAGQRDFGENYVQELIRKAEELRDLPDLRLHLIGHLQTNKAKSVANQVAMVQSLDSVRLVLELDKRVTTPLAQARGWPVPPVWRGAGTSAHPRPGALAVLIEVNLGDEAQKTGARPEEVPAILEALEASANLCAYGLMTVPPFSLAPSAARPYFDRLRELRDELGGVSRLPELSMGMTLDLEEAILAGATMVRVGTAIFGERPSVGGV